MGNTALLEVGEEALQSTSPIPQDRTRLRVVSVSSGTPLFTDCLLEPAGWQRSQRKWSAAISWTVQILLLGIALLIPLLFTEALPTQQLVTFLLAPPPPPPPPTPDVPVAAPAKPVIGEIVSSRLVAPTKIPDRVRMIKEEEAPPAANVGVIGGVAGGVPGGQLGGVLGGIIGSTLIHSTVVQALAPPKRVRISQGVSAGMLINQIVPEYPSIAKTARVEGTVRLNAWITKDGSIERLTVLSGNPLLVNAAIDAVKQWRYKPFLLNGEPVQVETSIEVNFYLDRTGS
jgi:protein TonB